MALQLTSEWRATGIAPAAIAAEHHAEAPREAPYGDRTSRGRLGPEDVHDQQDRRQHERRENDGEPHRRPLFPSPLQHHRGAEDEKRVRGQNQRTDGGQPLRRDERGPAEEPRRSGDDAKLPERETKLGGSDHDSPPV